MVKMQSGFSLVELMVTVTILVLLTLAGASLSSTWIYRARTHETRTKIHQAYSMALALAQRNASGATGGALAGGFKLSDRNLVVCAGDPAGENCTFNNASALWKSSLPRGITVKINDSEDAKQTLAFDNNGVARTSDGAVVATKFEIISGSESETGHLR